MLQISKCEKYECYISNKCKKRYFLTFPESKKTIQHRKISVSKTQLKCKKKFLHSIKKGSTK